MTRRYRAFISYSWADKAWAGWLHRSLETYRTPKGLVGRDTPVGPVPARLHPIFKDREEEAAGHAIRASIEAAMADAEFLVVVCSPRSVRSTWVNQEIAWFKTHRSKSRILALVVDGEPGISLTEGVLPQDSTRECFPPALLYQVDDRLRPTSMAEDLPLAADARRRGDGKRLARLKLVAALLGLGLDTLLKRDDRRRATRLRWSAIIMGTIAASMSALAVVAVQQRDRARAMQAAAEVQRDQAEGLIEFMIDDLRHKLEDDVQLEVMADIASRAQAYYVVQTGVRMDDDALGRRARVLDLLGDIKQDFGDSGAALDLLRESVASSAELLRRDPGNPQRIIEQAHGLQGLGGLSYQRGEIAEAEAFMREAVALTARLRALEPDEPEWLGEHGSALVNLGAMRLNSNALDEAVASFREAVDIKRAVLDVAHHRDAAQYDLSLTLAWLARALFVQGELDGALDAWSDEEAVIADMLSDDEVNYPVIRRRALNRINRSEAFLLAREAEAALTLAQSAVGDADLFLDANPSDARGMETAARARLVLANALLVLDRLDAATVAGARAGTLVDQLIEIDAERYAWSGPLRGSEQVLATTLAARASPDPAACRAALASIAPEAERLDALSANRPDDAEIAAIAARALLLLGDAAALDRRHDEALALWERAAVRVRAAEAASSPSNPASRQVAHDLELRRREPSAVVETALCGPPSGIASPGTNEPSPMATTNNGVNRHGSDGPE
ncbi:toll/interleukin-1 receptor domain-containing protein [Wenzhouxiangella sp. XN79A]|uniref:toll/interleukin-1 receptor domain-containing protein n=1 Tax=Wenzhouxiangella sp. XN79A TaxID=2724193 RepID=UPI00144ABE62|nr:toll/interleukin-1 receptor domain-containing protein [Wenzhouxiangella sp. XN79A]NKI35606.1 toll/interleukin-1 receptor domain-containing protein [Wenzhouxiangella sp. XN79A]